MKGATTFLPSVQIHVNPLTLPSTQKVLDVLD